MIKHLYSLLDAPLVPLLSKEYISKHIILRNYERFRERSFVAGDSYHEPVKPRDDFSFLYLHGWSASVLETAPLCKNLSEMYNARVYIPCLYRHRALSAPMDYIDALEWLYSAIKALHLALSVSKKVMLIGCSTGATLALLLSAGRYLSQKIICNLLLSPNLGVFPAYIDTMKNIVVDLFYKKISNLKKTSRDGDMHDIYRHGKGIRVSSTKKHMLYSIADIRNTKHLMHRIPFSSLRPMARLVAAAWHIVRKRPHRYKTNSLIIANTQDPSVNYKKTQEFFSRYPATAIVNTDIIGGTRGIHVPAGNFFAPQYTKKVVQRIHTYIKQIGYN